MPQKPIVHDYFYADGPKTYEWPLPVEPKQTKLPLPDTFLAHKQLDSRTVADLMFSKSLRPKGAVSRKVLSWLKPYTPHSLVAFEENAWVLFKHKSKLNEVSKHGNAILIAADRSVPKEIAGFPIADHPEFFEFLTLFKNILGLIPPTGGIWRGDKPLGRLATNEMHWGGQRMEPWINSLVIYILAAGDVLLLAPDGRLGCWNHGAVNPQSRYTLVTQISTKEFLTQLKEELGVVEDG